MDHYDDIIIGGGLSGLSAAVELCARGHTVLVVEQSPHCGGRTRSFFDPATGTHVDNGQHLMMGCYHAARRFLRIIGTDHLAFLQPSLRIDYLNPSNAQKSLSCSKLPAPLHLLSGMLGFNAIPFNDRFALMSVVKDLWNTSPAKELKLDQITAEEWLAQRGQSGAARKYLWDVVTIGALNNHPSKVSALLLYRVLRAAFLGKREHASLFIPKVGLSELFVDPAVRFIENHGGEVRTGIGVKQLQREGPHIRSVRTSEGKDLCAASFISAVPWYAAAELLPPAHSPLGLTSGRFDTRFHSSPIISIHLWLDREVTTLDFAALIDTRIQWLFNKSKLLNERTLRSPIRQGLSLVISGAQEFIQLNKKQLVALAMEDLQRVLPPARDARVVHSLVIKEKRATFLPAPGLDACRPDARTGYDNLFLAGDWTATGYPATIEGAVMSGRKAAEAVGEV
ncbi:MAG: FAD-dependent oxidoreductase [Ignavibacteriae bacterium]|nr:MAG: FAD-dependent oxidoreductase [Ignavibacteriota bacterium]